MSSAMATLEAGLRALAPLAGFNHFDEDRAGRGVRRMAILAVVAWCVFVAAPWLGGGATLAAMVLLSIVLGVLAGSVLNAAQTNVELATILVTGIQEMEQKAKRPAAQAAPQAQVAASSPAVSPAFSALASPALPIAAPQAPRMLTQGEIDGRTYTLYSDGSIEMETVFGRRWFASLDVAHEFIGYRAGAAGPAHQFAARLN